MIKSIELWDFESHEHSVMDDFSSMVNLVCGESNSGKTSTIRALKLAAFNQFDPKSVRIGASKCVVLVTTDRGYVKVTRGPKHNNWEIGRTGQYARFFDKVGTKIVPEAAEVLGLNIVTLGDVQVPVNIMDQLESHFMLSSMGGKNATGSMRAQVIDEVSGLSGIEGLITGVSLDRHRIGRDIAETEKSMEEIRSRMHPQSDLDVERTLLESVQRTLDQMDQMTEVMRSLEEIGKKRDAVLVRMDDTKRRLSEIPDTKRAAEYFDQANYVALRLDAAIGLGKKCKEIAARASDNRDRLGKMPDLVPISENVDVAERMTSDLIAAAGIAKNRQSLMSRIAEGRSRIKVIDGALSAEEYLEEAERMAQGVIRLAEVAKRIAGIKGRIADGKKRISEIDAEIDRATREKDELMRNIKVCPLTLKPVSKECLEGATA